ncbi:MAG TPA: hypothetical protein VGO82_04525, partial [Enterovirga sp.]|nr:hypothetical protein [Enterovirga sp.]
MNELQRHEAAANRAGGARTGSPDAGSRGGDSATAARDSLSSVSDTAQQTLRTVRETAERAYDDATDRARQGYLAATRQAGEFRRNIPMSSGAARRAVENYVSENPVMVGV